MLVHCSFRVTDETQYWHHVVIDSILKMDLPLKISQINNDNNINDNPTILQIICPM